MITNYTTSDNPTFTVHDKELRICRNKKIYNVSINDVTNIFLKKRKRGLMSAFLDLGLFIVENIYDLHINTKDNREIKIKIKSSEKQYFLELISYIRKLRKNGTPAAPKISQFS